ncbi:MAG TPA: hypothetical protein DIC35_04670 [Candidatus Moranbacteria bacterium]|nr:hypothetical protein [Candidatus Moranbacteria bacterium]
MAIRVIIAKKDQGAQFFLETFFRRVFSDAKVDCYSDGESALENASKPMFEKHGKEGTIVVIGYKYDSPSMNGIDLARKFRGCHQNICIVMMSGFGTCIRKEAEEAGVDLFMEVPFASIGSAREKILQVISQ